MAHPIVNAGFRVRLDASGNVEPNEITIVYGGLTTLNCRMPKTEKFLAGKSWNQDTLKATLSTLKRSYKKLCLSGVYR